MNFGLRGQHVDQSIFVDRFVDREIRTNIDKSKLLQKINPCKQRVYKDLVYFAVIFSDLDRIQTCNLLSRNQVHYSVMLRGRFAGANIILFVNLQTIFSNKIPPADN